MHFRCNSVNVQGGGVGAEGGGWGGGGGEGWEGGLTWGLSAEAWSELDLRMTCFCAPTCHEDSDWLL